MEDHDLWENQQKTMREHSSVVGFTPMSLSESLNDILDITMDGNEEE